MTDDRKVGKGAGDVVAEPADMGCAETEITPLQALNSKGLQIL